jgi:RNA-binding protein YlmH
MKLNVIVSPRFSEALGKLAQAEIPVATAYKLKTVITLAAEEQKKFEDMRKSLIDKHAAKNKKGEIVKNEDGSYGVAEKNKEEFFKEIQELLEVEVEMPKIRVSSLGDKLQLSVQDLAILDGLLEE